MQNELQSLPFIATVVVSEVPSPAKSEPIELDLDTLQQVAGGVSPNSNW